MTQLPPRAFPATRMRRLRRHDWSRRLVAEHRLTVNDLIWPVFVVDQEEGEEAISSMPGVFRLGLAPLVRAAERAVALGIPAMAIFPATDPALKTEDAREAINPENLVCRATRRVKAAVGDQLGVICDVALDPFFG